MKAEAHSWPVKDAFALTCAPCSSISAIESEWRALAGSLGNSRSFHHCPEWYAAFSESGLADLGGLRVILLRAQERLVGVVPLQFQNYRVGPLRPRLLGTIEEDQLQSSDFLFSSDIDAGVALSAVIGWLKRHDRHAWDGLRLRKVPENSALSNAMRKHPPDGTRSLRQYANAYFNVQNVDPASVSAMTGDFRRNLQRQIRRADEAYAVRYVSSRNPGTLEPAFEAFLRVEASGWKGAQGSGTAINCQPALRRFYQELLNRFGAHGECVINILWFGDVPVAGQFALHVGRTLHVLKFGYDENYAKYAPGNALLYRVLQEACNDAGTDCVNLVNDPPWARRFRPLTRGVWSYYVPNDTLRGRLALAGLLVKRTLDQWRQVRADETGGTA